MGARENERRREHLFDLPFYLMFGKVSLTRSKVLELFDMLIQVPILNATYFQYFVLLFSTLLVYLTIFLENHNIILLIPDISSIFSSKILSLEFLIFLQY